MSYGTVDIVLPYRPGHIFLHFLQQEGYFRNLVGFYHLTFAAWMQVLFYYFVPVRVYFQIILPYLSPNGTIIEILTIGAYIKDKRKRFGLTQAELALPLSGPDVYDGSPSRNLTDPPL